MRQSAGGAVVRVRWPRSSFDHDAGPKRREADSAAKRARELIDDEATKLDTRRRLASAPSPPDKTLLIVDDDKPFAERLARAMTARGYGATVAFSVAEALAAIARAPPGFAVIDLKLGDGSGLDVMRALKDSAPGLRARSS